MLRVALTGNIAAGKSTVVELFRRWGASVVDADELARQVEAPGTAVLAAIARRFGADVLSADGSLDRAALRSKVMGDAAARAALNAIVHPAVRRRRDELDHAAAGRGDALLVNDIPLLFEALDPAQFDVVVLVDAPEAVRRARLRALRGLGAEDADRMIAAQLASGPKRARSHHVIENDGTLAQLERRARAVFGALRRRAAPLDVGTPAHRVLLVAAGHGDDRVALRALAARFEEAGAAATVTSGGAAAIVRALGAAPPDVTVATPRAGAAAREAWERAGRPGALFALGADAERGRPVDLRPWGGPRATLRDTPFA